MVTLRAADRKLLYQGTSRCGARYESQWLHDRRLAYTSSEFQVNGFVLLPLPAETASNLSGFFDERLTRTYSNDDVAPGFARVELPPEVAAKLNDFNVYYAPPAPDVRLILQQYLMDMAGTIEEQLGHGWRIANVRAWVTQPSTAFGGSAWHFDYFSNYLRKIMVYPHALSAENGSVELHDRQGRRHCLETHTPCGVLFDNSILLHRGKSSSVKPRPAIEVTIIPSATTDASCVFGGQAALCPDELPAAELEQLINQRYQPPEYRPSLGYRLARSVYRASRQIHRLVAAKGFGHAFQANPRTQQDQTAQIYANFARADADPVSNLMSGAVIGGGPQFSAPGWVNLDEVAGAANEFPFQFDAVCVFPIASSSIQTVYVLNLFRHADGGVVRRVLWECLRILSPEGLLVVKTPRNDTTAAGRLVEAGFELLSVDPARQREIISKIPGAIAPSDFRCCLVARRPERFLKQREIDVMQRTAT